MPGVKGLIAKFGKDLFTGTGENNSASDNDDKLSVTSDENTENLKEDPPKAGKEVTENVIRANKDKAVVINPVKMESSKPAANTISTEKTASQPTKGNSVAEKIAQAKAANNENANSAKSPKAVETAPSVKPKVEKVEIPANKSTSSDENNNTSGGRTQTISMRIAAMKEQRAAEEKPAPAPTPAPKSAPAPTPAPAPVVEETPKKATSIAERIAALKANNTAAAPTSSSNTTNTVTATPSKPVAAVAAAPVAAPINTTVDSTPKKLFGSTVQRKESPEKVAPPSFVKPPPVPAAPSSSSSAPSTAAPAASSVTNSDSTGSVRRSSIADRIASLQANGASSASGAAATTTPPPPPVEKKEVSPPPPAAAPVVKPVTPVRFVPPPPAAVAAVPSSSAASNNTNNSSESEQNSSSEGKKSSVADRIAALKAKGNAAVAAESTNNEPQLPVGGMGRRMSQDKIKMAGAINLAGLIPGGPRPMETQPKVEETPSEIEIQHATLSRVTVPAGKRASGRFNTKRISFADEQES